jgi:hypothetical protein
MPKQLKLALLLPIIQGTVAVVLLTWANTTATGGAYSAFVSSPTQICHALNAPAFVTFALLSKIAPRQTLVGGFLPSTLFVSLSLAMWYWIGTTIDRRNIYTRRRSGIAASNIFAILLLSGYAVLLLILGLAPITQGTFADIALSYPRLNTPEAVRAISGILYLLWFLVVAAVLVRSVADFRSSSVES